MDGFLNESPGSEKGGAVKNFEPYPKAAVWGLNALILIGRLEILTVLVLLTPAFWRPNIG